LGLKAIGTRRLVGAGLVCAALVAGGVAVLRSEGVRPTTVRSGPSTRWLVNQNTGYLLLADGLTGRVAARIEAEVNLTGEVPVDGAGGTFLVAAAQGSARAVNTSLLKVGTARTVALLSDAGTTFGVGPSGLTVVNAREGEASLLTSDEASPINIQPAELAAVAADGTIWLLRNGSVDHVFTDGRRVRASLGIDADRLVTVGDRAVAVDSTAGRLQWIGGAPQNSPIDSPDLVVQESSPSATCLWLAAGDELACVGMRAVERRLTVEGLAAAPGDTLAVHGRAAAIVRANNRGAQRIDLVDSRLVTAGQAEIDASAELRVSVADDLVWIDDTAGTKAWAVHPFGISDINKADDDAPLLDEQGQVADEGSSGGPGVGGEGPDAPPEERPLEDDNGTDDPPQAIDDAATAREGSALTIPVTSNDFDPDGEGIAVVTVTQGARGTVDIVNASTVVYRPELDYVGIDTFTYTITDEAGQEDTAEVAVELFDNDSPNRAPLSSADSASTAIDTSVVVDVLSNDVDPERDPLDIASTETPANGQVILSAGPSGLPALRYVPAEGFTGTDTFRYIAIDPAQGLGEPTEVTVQVGSDDGTNQPPVARPDAVRLQRERADDVAVLLNDTDPDNDLLSLSVPGPELAGFTVTVKGDQLNIAAGAGAPPRAEVVYRIDDGQGHEAFGKVLVVVIAGGDNNSAPLAVADLDRVVAGQSALVPVLDNDLDPDGDSLGITGVRAPTDGSATVSVEGNQVRMVPTDTDIDESFVIQASYTISDGRGGTDIGTISLTVLPEALPDPPFASDDSATTEQDQPVVIDVLANDGDPSGGEPELVGPPACAAGGRATLTADRRVSFTPPAGATGVFRCRYEVTNDRGLRASAAIIVTVIEPVVTNRPPQIDPRTYDADAGGPPITIDLRAGVTDNDPGDSFTVRVVPPLPPGAVVSGEDTVVYAAPANSTGFATIQFRATDSRNASAVGAVTIEIDDPALEPPTARPINLTVLNGDPFTIDITAYANDPDGTPAGLNIRDVGAVSGGGSMSIGGNTRLLVVDPPETATQMSAQIIIADPQGLTATTTVTVVVEIPTNRPPVAVNDQLPIAAGRSGQVNVLSNDNDPDGDPLTVTVSPVSTSLGTVSVNGAVVGFSATPSQDGGTVTLEYTISDGEFTDSAVLTIIVAACSESPPIASSASLFTPYQTPIAIDLNQYASNGTVEDVSGAGLTGPTGTYTPPAGFNGNVTVNFSVVNACRLRDSGVVTIDVNRDPVPTPVNLSLKRGQYFEIQVNQLATDVPEVLTITAVNGEPNWVDKSPTMLSGTATPRGNRTVFSFNVTVADPGGLTATSTVTITLLPNEPPVAVDDSRDITAPGEFSFDPIDNDFDPDGDPLTLRSAQFTSGGGSLSINGNVLTIDADHGYSTITYVVEDPSGDTDTGTISILANQSPNANDVGPITQDGVVELSAGDPDGDALALTTSNVPAGVLVIVGPNLFMAVQLGTFTGDGSFTYTVTDPFGKSASARVLLSVEPPPGD
jgi:hypothetical protein